MSKRRFNQVFAALMGGAFLCAFVLPSTLIDPLRIHGAGVFNPLSYPIRRLAQAVYRPPAAAADGDQRSAAALLRENDQLRQEVARLQATVDQLAGVASERKNLGRLESLCVRVAVAGGDAGGRDGLILSSVSGASLSEDQPVLYSGGLAGRLEAARGGARVRLITDEGFAVTGAFYRFSYVGGALVPSKINAPTPLVKGLGQGRLAVVGMKLADFKTAALMAGDWVVLDDPQWPKAVQNVRLGQVVSAQSMRGSPLYLNILLAPATDLTKLSDVWVLARD